MEKIVVVLYGMVWGSFLNVVIFRVPAGMSLIHPPSSCPKCKKRIKPYDNIPVVSWILLGGKCRFCKARIPVSYVLVEFLTPLCFLAANARFGLSAHFFAACLFSSAMIVLALIDFHHQILPDIITLLGAAAALGYAFFRKDLTLPQALLGAAVGAGFLLLVFGGYWLVRRKEGLGIGDVKLMLFVGAFIGWKLTLLTLILASFTGAIAGAFLLAGRKKDMQSAIPFGTFLAPAAFIALIWGDKIIRGYLSLFQR